MWHWQCHFSEIVSTEMACLSETQYKKHRVSLKLHNLGLKLSILIRKWLGSTFLIRISVSISKSGSYRYCNFTHGSDYCQNKDSIGRTNYINSIQDIINYYTSPEIRIWKIFDLILHLNMAICALWRHKLFDLWRHNMHEHTKGYFFLTIGSLRWFFLEITSYTRSWMLNKVDLGLVKMG